MADVEKDIVLRVKSETDQAQGQFKSLKSELRSMEQQLQQMEASGQAGTEAFKQLQQQAGKVKDQINDTKGAIKALSSDTFRLDAFAQGAQAIAGGFAAAQGAIALFGGENKAVEEAIKKTQGAMALLQGVTAITNVLQKESALRLGIASVAQATYTTIVGASTGAMKLFRLALASTGIGALVVGLGMLIANFDDVKKTVLNLLKPFDGIIAKVRDFLSVISFGLIDDTSTAKTKANAEEAVEAINKTTKATDAQTKAYERQIEIAKAQGKSLEEIYRLEKQLIDYRLSTNAEHQKALDMKVKAGIASKEEKDKLYDLVNAERDLLKERTLLDIKFKSDKDKRQKEADTKELERRKKGYKEIEEISTQTADAESKLEAQRNAQISSNTESLIAQADLYKKIADDQAEEDRKRFEKRTESAKMWMQTGSEGISALMSLNEAFAKKDEASQRKAFERNKKLQIAQAVMNTAEAITAQLAVPQDALTGVNFVKAGIALATGIAQVKKISSTTFQGGNSAPNGGSLNAPDTSPSGGAMQTNNISSTQLQLDAQGNLKQQQVRTYVLETDISDKQKRSSRLQKTATFGR